MISVMQKLRPIVSKKGVQVATAVTISGPPQHKISTLEKVSCCAIMTIASLLYPSYIMANLRYYRGDEDAQDGSE